MLYRITCRLADSELFLVILFIAVLGVALIQCDPVPALADRKVVSARLASMRFPTPTFDEVHRAFARICGNESGMKSLADQDGILQSLLHGGGGRKAGRRHRGQGYGLDYARLMRQMARHSTRTFPADSKFLMLTTPQRAWLKRRQTRANRWTSTLRLDCSKPSGWPEFKLDGVTPMMEWRHFDERCKRLVQTTGDVLKGTVRSHCDGKPTTWGSLWDIEQPDGALEKGWTEIHCDRPPDSPETCELKTKLEKWNGTTCARNTFWTWLKVDAGDIKSVVIPPI